MKKYFLGSLFVALFFLFQAPPALADIRYVHSSSDELGQPLGPEGFFNLVQGTTETYCWVFGPWVDHAYTVTASGSGVVPVIAEKKGFINFRELVLTGRTKLRFIVAGDASPGTRTITLHTTKGEFDFKVRVLRNGRVTRVDIPPQTQFFDEVNITFTGERLDNAGVQATSFPGLLSAVVTENSSTRAVVKLKFSSDLAEASGNIRLFDKACAAHYPCRLGSDGLNALYAGASNSGGNNYVTITGPNAVRSITFPNGSSVSSGSVLTIQINLTRPAGQQGELVRWQLVPSNVFEAAPGSGTRFTPPDFSRVTVPAGDTFVLLQVRLREIPQGCVQQCTGEVQTRIGTSNSDQPPFYKSERFTIIVPRRN